MELEIYWFKWKQKTRNVWASGFSSY